MKQLLILLSLSISMVSNAQVDPAFTANVIATVNAAEDYANAPEANKQAAFEALHESFRSFWPMTQQLFSSKMQSMLNSPQEMAKFSNPIGFVQCLAPHASAYYNCIKNTSETTYPSGTSFPNPSHPDNCTYAFAPQIIQCAATHL
jgi:hypothetical protein